MLNGLFNAGHIGAQFVVAALHGIEGIIGRGEAVTHFLEFTLELALCGCVGLQLQLAFMQQALALTALLMHGGVA